MSPHLRKGLLASSIVQGRGYPFAVRARFVDPSSDRCEALVVCIYCIRNAILGHLRMPRAGPL